MPTNAWLTVATVLVLAALAAVGWASRFEYHRTHKDYLVRVHRFTGYADFLTPEHGWRRAPVASSKASASSGETAARLQAYRRLTRARMERQDSIIAHLRHQLDSLSTLQ
jgi:hypothetical protein